MVTRALAAHARAVARRYPVLAVTGPRQSGKTTFCRAEFAEHEYEIHSSTPIPRAPTSRSGRVTMSAATVNGSSAHETGLRAADCVPDPMSIVPLRTQRCLPESPRSMCTR